MYGVHLTWIVGLGVLLLFFLLGREILCWYWKLNTIVSEMERQNAELVAIRGLLKKLVMQGELRGTSGPAEAGRTAVAAPIDPQ